MKPHFSTLIRRNNNGDASDIIFLDIDKPHDRIDSENGWEEDGRDIYDKSKRGEDI